MHTRPDTTPTRLRRAIVRSAGALSCLIAVSLLATGSASAAVWAGVTAGAAATPRSGSHAAAPAPWVRVDAFGDSLMHQTDFYLTSAFDPSTTRVHVDAVSGSALCDWVYPKMRTTPTGLVANPAPGAILRLTAADAPTVAILEFAGNDFTPCIADSPFTEASYLENYETSLRAAIDHLLAIGTAHVIVDEGPPTRAELAAPASDQLRATYEQVVASYASTHVTDASAADASVLTTSGGYATTLPCLALERRVARCADVEVAGQPSNVVRSPDGIHFCPDSQGGPNGVVPGLCLAYSSGAYRYAMALAADVWRLLPSTKPGTAPVVAAVTPSPGGTLTVAGYALSGARRVCFVTLSFPSLGGVPFTAGTPFVSARCVRPAGRPTANDLAVRVPASLVVAPPGPGGTFVAVTTPDATSVIGLATDQLLP